MTEAGEVAKGRRVRIWDLPVRLFHWAMAALIALAWWTATHDQMNLHRPIGYAASGLLAFRVYWGLCGGSTARFTNFVRGPRAVFAYARKLARRPDRPAPPGHNPMGGWSVLALLAAIAAVCALGLFSVDVDGENSGPLADRVSFEVGRAAAHWHHLGFNLLLGLIGIHLAAVLYYFVARGVDLVLPMITGTGSADGDDLRPGGALRLAIGVLLGAACVIALTRLR